MPNSRRKGADGERGLANELASYGFPTRRGQQYRGGGDSPDVVGLPGIHIECKRVEHLNIEKAMVQSRRDAEGTEDVPVVMHRKNYERWKVTMDLDKFMNMYLAATCDSMLVNRYPVANSYPVVNSDTCMPEA